MYKSVYDINNLMIEMGGVIKSLLVIFGILIKPISDHLYHIEMVKRLYLARTKDKNLLKPPSKKENLPKWYQKIKEYVSTKSFKCSYDADMRKEMKKHRMIRIGCKDTVLLFFYNTLNNVMCRSICPWNKRIKLQKLYQRSKDKLGKEVGLINFLKTIKLLKIVLRNSIFTDKIRFETIHSNKCTIDLDSEDSSSNDDKQD